MRVLNICQDDWANFSYDNAKALRSVGIEAKSIKRNPHVWGYEQECEIWQNISQIRRLIRQYDVIQFFHDNIQLFKQIRMAFYGKKVIVYHTSSYYRKFYSKVDHLMNIYADKVVCAMPEFMGLCNNNKKVYMVGAVDTDKLTPSKKRYTEAKFAHFPSNPGVKGTTDIIRMMEGYNFSFSNKNVSSEAHIKRLKDSCNIYIELFSMKDGEGSPYGNFGITALEAAALGKIVITNCLGQQVYEDHYGPIGLHIANTEDDFLETAHTLREMSIQTIKAKQKLTREWVVENHSYKASGEYIINNIL